MRFFRSKPGRIVTGVIVVLALFLVRPGAQRLRTRIVRSISLALGRPVDVGSVTLRLLPQPGFELENFVVHDDPAFGAEPVLQSSDVVAVLRVTSLLRGRLEIARLSLAEPSLNLVRNSEGHWNLENLLERAAKIPVAPTAKLRSEGRPGFPYIEADHGRINFKFGQEKKPYTLTDANFALWQESENAWGLRLKAQPTRTDFNLSDTGLLEVEGSWQRAANLHQTPVQFAVQWEGAQLGQVTKLTLGQDKGWRGAIGISASLAGTPEDLTVTTDGSVQDFRRYDITSSKALRLTATCTGHYSTSDHVLSRLVCRAPVGDGRVALHGSLSLISAPRVYDLSVLAENLPLQPLLDLGRRVKKNLPADMVATGKLDGQVTMRQTIDGIGPEWQGGGAVVGLTVRSPLNNTRLALERIPFVVSSDRAPLLNSHSGQNRIRHTALAIEPQVSIGPFGLGLGRLAIASVRGQVSRSGYNVVVQGDAEVQRLLDIARTAGLPAPQLTANGEARVNLHIGGNWADFAAPLVTGTAQLESVHARVRGLNEPIEVTAATLALSSETTEVQKLVLVAAGNTWQGSMTVPRRCNTPRTCPIRFNLRADEVVTEALVAGSADSGKQPWYRFLSSAAQPSLSQPRPYLASVHAIGKLSAGRVLIHNLVANRVSTDVELEQGRLELHNLRGEILGGRHTGEWTADFAVNPPIYSGDGTLEKVALGQLADAMHDTWVTGTANLEYRATTAGWTKPELLSGADASFQVDARDGSLPHLSLSGEAAPLRVSRFAGRLRLRDGKIEIGEGKLQTPASIYQLSGTASLSRVLDIKVMRDGGRGFNITGTLTQPHVVMNTTSETQAALKP